MDVTAPSKEERTWAMVAHLSGLLAAALSAGILVFLGPLIVWLIKKDESHFVDDQGKEALNFQLTILIIYVLVWGVILLSCGLLFPLLAVPFILQIIFGIMAAVKANNGEYYRYPVNIRFLK